MIVTNKHLLLLATTFAVACRADFVDLEKYEFPCASSSECSAERACYDGRCIWSEDAPFPAFGIFIEDITVGSSCDTAAPGTDLYAISLADEGDVIAISAPHSRRVAGGRGFEFGLGDNEFRDDSNWNAHLAGGPENLGRCPESTTGQVVSMGCGGTAFFSFIEPPWRTTGKDGTARTVSIFAEDTIQTHTLGADCATDADPASVAERYRVYVCPRTVFRHFDTGWDVDRELCPLILDNGAGDTVASVPPDIFER